MRKILFILFAFIITNILSVGRAQAAAPIQVSVFNPVQMVEESEDVKGLRFNLIYGVNDDVSGIDLGLINKTQGYQKGFQMGIYNSTFDFSGLQFGLVNRTDWLNGVQIGLVNIHKEGDVGFFPLVNFSF